MKVLNLTAVIILLITTSAQAGIDVIYGEDNRQDLYEVSNSLYRELAQSTAAMVDNRHFVKGKKAGTFDFPHANTLVDAMNLCSTENFSQQKAAASCSGFLVAPDVIVTAGHCYEAISTPEQVCKANSWVFGYDLDNKSKNPAEGIPASNVYSCKKVVASQLNDTMDFAVIKLDRVVKGRVPLNFRTAGKISDKASLVVIGHPTGLPTKVSAGARVTRNSEKTRFSSNLDTFHGNSGSAVFDATTGVIEGILIQGKTDYVLSNPKQPDSCQVVNKCDNNGDKCMFDGDDSSLGWGEIVLRIQPVAKFIKQAQKL